MVGLRHPLVVPAPAAGGVALNGYAPANRATRRRTLGSLRPTCDLEVTGLGPFVYVGFLGSGYVRLSRSEALDLARTLESLARSARPDQPSSEEIPPCPTLSESP